MNKHEATFGLILSAVAILILWLLNKKGLLHENVTSKIITPQGTITPDPLTGMPRFDSTIEATIPANFPDNAVSPIASNGIATPYPIDPTKATCPIGYQMYKDEATGAYWCVLV